MKRPSLVLVVAVADNGVIGAGGAMPWHISADFRRVKALTMGKPLVMGRKTFDSLPGILPGRRHIVITRDGAWEAEGAERAGSLGEALALANAPEIIIFGGAQIYAEALPLAVCVEVTEIAQDFDGDAYAPVLGPEWVETAREHHVSTNGLPFSFVTRVRRS